MCPNYKMPELPNEPCNSQQVTEIGDQYNLERPQSAFTPNLITFIIFNVIPE